MMKRSTKTSFAKQDVSRLFRDFIETANELERVLRDANSLSHIFTEVAISCRQRLKDKCESIIYSSPVEYGRRSEEVLWKRCYHDVMQYYKRNKKKIPIEETKLLQIHLITGFGYYYNLIIGISKHCKISLKKLMLYIRVESDMSDVFDENVCESDEVISWTHVTIHRYLIYMGDLARYLYELQFSGYRDISIRFYDSALIWNPSVGMPFNQLGTLSESNNYGLDSVYYYMRCLICEKPFDGAENNLRRIFENSRKQLYDLNEQKVVEESYELVKLSILKFLKMTNEFWFMKWSDSKVESNVSPLLKEVMFSFMNAFNLKPKLTTDGMPSYLSQLIVFEISVITLIMINRIEERVSLTSSQIQTPIVSSIVEFSIDLMTSVISSCHQNLRIKLGLDLSCISNTSQGMSNENTPELSPRRALSRLRRRKAVINYDDRNPLSLEAEDDDSELSELEETALSTIDALDIGSDLSDSNDDNDSENIDITVIISDDDNSQSKPIEETDFEPSVLPAEQLLDFILNESYLPSIKMYCDWLRCDPNILTVNSINFQNFFQELISFVNTLITVEQKVLLAFPNLHELKCNDKYWVQKYPLASDLSLSNIKRFNYCFDDLNINNHKVLSNVDKSFICIQSLVSFSYFLTDNKHCPTIYDIAYDDNEKCFSFDCLSNGLTQLSFYDSNTWSDANPLFLSNNGIINHNQENDIANDQTNDQKKKMRTLAHLWLKAEVNQLEKDINGWPQLPAYIVFDSSAYCEHLNLIKDLSSTKRFMLVVPRIVLDSLDQMKRSSVNAREASRWIEEELKRGNRFIKYLKDSEKLSLSPIKYPKRKDKDALYYFEMLEYCNYLNNSSNKIGQRKQVHGIPMVSLLTHSLDKWPSNAEAVARTSDIHIETIDSFLSKWQNSNKTNS